MIHIPYRRLTTIHGYASLWYSDLRVNKKQHKLILIAKNHLTNFISQFLTLLILDHHFDR
jgi:hypothetical protein